jgi:proteasome lid subunit RPN8/RPN11
MLWLSHEQARALVKHAQAAAPNEACGIIAGEKSRAVEIIPIANAAENPQQTYYMDEQALARALLPLHRRGMSLLAFYHSHPKSDPIPSPVDVRSATYPDTPYLIVGLKGEPRLAAWQMRYGEVTPVPLHIGFDPPESSTGSELTKAQKIAILLSALIAFVLVLVLSLSLLPPAPAIP